MSSTVPYESLTAQSETVSWMNLIGAMAIAPKELSELRLSTSEDDLLSCTTLCVAELGDRKGAVDAMLSTWPKVWDQVTDADKGEGGA